MASTSKYMKLFGENMEVMNYANIDQDLLDRVAKSILNKYQIVTQDKTGEIKQYRICEIEFYVKNESHNDEYVDQDDLQMTYGKWYFHRTKIGNYKGGTYKGVNLTLGDVDSNTCFGVLIRSIYSTEDNEFIEGPCKAVNKLLELNLCKNVKDYMKDKSDPPNARSIKNFYIKRCKGLEKHDVHSGPRIGLSKKYPDFKDKSYRYVIMNDRLKKDVKSLNLVE
jgi:hypothetical protein